MTKRQKFIKQLRKYDKGESEFIVELTMSVIGIDGDPEKETGRRSFYGYGNTEDGAVNDAIQTMLHGETIDCTGGASAGKQ